MHVRTSTAVRLFSCAELGKRQRNTLRFFHYEQAQYEIMRHWGHGMCNANSMHTTRNNRLSSSTDKAHYHGNGLERIGGTMATSLGSRMAHCNGRHEDSRIRLKHTLARNTEAHTVLYDTEGSCRGFVFSMDKTHKSMQKHLRSSANDKIPRRIGAEPERTESTRCYTWKDVHGSAHISDQTNANRKLADVIGKSDDGKLLIQTHYHWLPMTARQFQGALSKSKNLSTLSNGWQLGRQL